MRLADDQRTPRLALDRLSALGAAGSGQALRAVSMRLMPGQCIAILGAEADGSALLLDVVLGHATFGAGTLSLDGLPASDLPPRRRGTALASVRDPLFSHLDVAGNIAFPLRAAHVAAAERAARVGEAVALLGLDPVAARRPSRLTLAEQVRCRLARALVLEPKLLLLEQPSEGLDPSDRAALHRLIRRLVRARDLTMLLATTDRDEALWLGDRIGVLDRGTLHQTGTAADLLDRPVNAAVAERIGDANLLPGRIVDCDDEVALVRLASGHTMAAEPGGTLGAGDACVLCVRPDRIATAFLSRLPADEPAARAGDDTLPATLLEAVHFGDHLRLRFRLADGADVLVRRPPAAAMAGMVPDRPAMLAWQAHQARVFPA